MMRILVLSTTASQVSAWGGGRYEATHRMGYSLTILTACKDEESRFRAEIERTFTLRDQEDWDFIGDPQFEETLFVDQTYEVAENSFLYAAANGALNDVLDIENVCGADCEECPIPEEYKVLPWDLKVDVMKFLGIERAKPLRVERNEQDWE
jgi:hypothetical protein